MQTGKGKISNAAQLEITNYLGQGRKTCAENKGNIECEKGSQK